MSILQAARRRLNVFLNMLELPKFHGKYRIFVLTTESRSKGETDFKTVLDENNIKIFMTKRMENKYKSEALYKAILDLDHSLKDGDIVAIIRGGGDTENPQFLSFKNKKACEIIREISSKKSIIFITGIGHSEDKFAIDEFVTYSKITPTAAGNCIVELIS